MRISSSNSAYTAQNINKSSFGINPLTAQRVAKLALGGTRDEMVRTARIESSNAIAIDPLTELYLQTMKREEAIKAKNYPEAAQADNKADFYWNLFKKSFK